MKTLLNTLAATIAFTLFPIAVVLAVDSTKSASPAKADALHHAAEFKGETILHIDGMGPCDIHALNPAANPNKPAAAAK